MARRQSAKVRQLYGANPSRRQRTPAPEASGKAPPRPAYLTEQQQLWTWLENELRREGLLRPLAAAPMTEWVVAVSLRDNAAALLAAEGITTEGRRDGQVVKHPSVGTWRAACDSARRASRDLGSLPPAAHPVVPPKEGWKDPARLLTPPRG